MDAASHLLLGIQLTRYALEFFPETSAEQRLLCFCAAGIASLLPDLDYLPALLRAHCSSLRLAWRYHRKLLHSLLAAPLLALFAVLLSYYVLTPLYSTLLPSSSASVNVQGFHLPTAYCLSFIAVCSHLALDALTAFGVALFHPFSTKLRSLPLLYLFDPLFLLLTLIGLFIPAQSALIVLLSYFLLSALFHFIARRKILQDLPNHYGRPVRWSLLPGTFWPWRRFAVFQFQDRYLLAYYQLFHPLRWYSTARQASSEHLLKRAKENPTLAAYLQVARFPRAETRNRGDERYLILDDLRWWAEENRRIMTITARYYRSGFKEIRETSKLSQGPFGEPEPLPRDPLPA